MSVAFEWRCPVTCEPSLDIDAPGLALTIEHRVEAGKKLVPRLPDRINADIDGDLKAVYSDIQAALRVPFVNFVFRMLANFPAYFLPAWEMLAPRLRSLEFETAADRLRAAALGDIAVQVFDPARLGAADRQAIGDFTDSIHYVLPKLLLVATILDKQIESPTLLELVPTEQLETLDAGITDGTRLLSLVDPDVADQSVVAVFDDIRQCHGHPGVASYYRGLANYPSFLETIWGHVRTHVDTSNYRAGKTSILTLADSLALSFLGNKQTERKAADRDSVRSILAVFRYHIIPDLLMDVTLIQAMLKGPSSAAHSRLSIGASTRPAD